MAPIAASAKDKHEPSALELQQLQARDVEADKNSGLITGISSTKSKMTYSLWTGFGKSKKLPIVSAFIESR